MGDGHFTLEMGGIPITIHLQAHLDTTPLTTYYAPFLTTETGEWVVKVKVDTTVTDDMSPYMRVVGARTEFRTMSHEGWVDLAAHYAEVTTPTQSRVHSAIVRVVSFIVMQTLPRRGEGILLHAAGIAIQGKGHGFFGASGRGKSTISRLARGVGTVLTDENVIIRWIAGRPYLCSTPFWGLSTPADEIHQVGQYRVPLIALYTLDHTPDFRIERLSAGRAAMALLTTEKVATERNESADAWLAIVERLVREVPIYHLGFRPTHDLWNFLAEKDLIESSYDTACDAIS